ncbi:MAG: sulfatase-like hydrolase/transferase, partial [Bacteroidales bacterium]
MSKNQTRRPRTGPPPVPPAPAPRAVSGRWRLLAAAALVMIAVIVLMWRQRTVAPAPGNGPIILISIDTLRADHLPVYGYRKVETPAIDALARDGIVFDRAYAHSPQTFPSHTSILSGELPFETGIRDNVGFTLGASVPWLPEVLRQHGFATGGVVSAFVLRKETGINRGFDFFDGEMPPARPDKPMGEVQRAGTESLAVAERWMGGLASPRF